MKKLLCFLLILSFSTLALKAYTKTGYVNFKEIEFLEDGELLVNISQAKLKEAFKSLGRRKLWGWKTHYMNLLKDVTFVGEEIFSRSNRTSNPYDFDYQLKEVEYDERTFGATGTISAKTKGKIKKFDLNLDAAIKTEIGTKSSVTKTEELKLKVQVMPNTKLTLRTAGEAKVSNGVGIYYIMGIIFKKGAWETVDIETIHYELIEENLE